MTQDSGVRSARSSVTGFLTCLAALLLLVARPTGASTVKALAPAQLLECPSCEDFNWCTVESCDTTTGTCRHDPRDCDDQNPCTRDSCVQAAISFCAHAPLTAGTTCDDGIACTQNDACDASAQCVG